MPESWPQHQVGRCLGVIEKFLTRRAQRCPHRQTADEIENLARAHRDRKVSREFAVSERIGEGRTLAVRAKSFSLRTKNRIEARAPNSHLDDKIVDRHSVVAFLPEHLGRFCKRGILELDKRAVTPVIIERLCVVIVRAD